MSSRPPDDPERIRERVRLHYGAAASPGHSPPATCCTREGGGCGPGDGRGFGPALYPEHDLAGLPRATVETSLGCGNPTAVADLRPGETVLDLGSGAGLDLLVSARRVGPTGRVYGLDMTDEMLELAGRSIREAGGDNVVLLRGVIESIPLPTATVDVVISNCVVNLSVDKPAVFAEVHRVLRPGGRMGIADVVAEDGLSDVDRGERGSHAECLAGALSIGEYRRLLRAAGFEDVEIITTHGVADRMHGALVRATKPTGSGRRTRTDRPPRADPPEARPDALTGVPVVDDMREEA